MYRPTDMEHPFSETELATLQCADVICFGAGPVGLWFAIQTALRAQERGESPNIVVIEKRLSYALNHALWLNPKLFRHKMHPDTNIPELLSNHPIQLKANEIQQLLESRARSLGIQIVRSQALQDFAQKHLNINPEAYLFKYPYLQAIKHGQAVYLNTILSLCPNVTRVAGTDGAHSVIRKHYFKDRLSHEKTLRYVAQLTLNLDLNDFPAEVQWSHPTTRFLDFKALEYIERRQSSGQARMTVRFLIDKNTFSQLRKTRSDGTVLTSPSLPIQGVACLNHPLLNDALRITIERWLNQKRAQFKKHYGKPLPIMPESIRLTTIALSQYQSRDIWKRLDNTTHCVLEGDAARFTQLYTNLNTSFRTSCDAAQAFALSDPVSREKALRAYEKRTNRYCARVRLWVDIKNFFLTIVAWLVSAGFSTPVKLINWGYGLAAQMQNDEEKKYPVRQTPIHFSSEPSHPQLPTYQGRLQRQTPSPVPLIPALERSTCHQKIKP